MEEIIGILVLIAALIFKVVGKKFNDAAAASPQEPYVPEEAPMIRVDVPKPVEIVNEAAPEKVKKAVKPKKNVAKILKEEKPAREKIDPKKLIIYSEIMNRKY